VAVRKEEGWGMSEEFNEWWNNDLLTEDNPFVDGTPAYWAWEGWCAAVKVEREACAKVVDEFVGCESVAYKIRARSNT
jgi:hypothetical protein